MKEIHVSFSNYPAIIDEIKKEYEVIDGVEWLKYGVLCDHDDAFLCEHRWDFIKNYIKK